MKYPIAFMFVSSVIAFDLIQNHGYWAHQAYSMFARVADFVMG
jgi:hypothetical protein